MFRGYFVEKKVIVALLLLLFCSTVWSATDSITSFSVKQNVNLNQPVTAFGNFQDDVNLHGNVLCSFYLQDASTGVLIDQADDDYTDARGNFAMSFPITEPDFDRDGNYAVQVVCGEATDTNYFVVGNFETIADSTAQNFAYVTDNENVDTILIIGGFLGILFIVLLFGWWIKKFSEKW